jgi:hypothetical protein
MTWFNNLHLCLNVYIFMKSRCTITNFTSTIIDLALLFAV